MAHIQRRCPSCSIAVQRGRKSCSRCGGTKFSYRVRYVDDDGAEKSKTFRLRADAEIFETSVSHQLLAGTYIDPAAGRTTVREFGEMWRLNQAHLRPGSAKSLEQAFRVHVYPFLGHCPLSSLRPSDLAKWQTGRLQPTGPLAPASAYRIRGQFSAMLKAAIADRVISANPFDAVKAPTVDEDQVVPLTPAQVAMLEENLLLHTRGGRDVDRYQAIVPFIAGSGLRPSEAFGVTVDRLDFLRKQVRVDRQLLGRARGGAPIFGPPKTASSTRTVPLADTTIYRLAEHLEKYPAGQGGLVFYTGRGGGALTRQMFANAWRPAAESIGLELGDGPHQLRHFYASVLIDAGLSVKVVQARLGHKSAVETLNRYAHLWPDSTAADNTRAAVEAALVRPSQAVEESARPS